MDAQKIVMQASIVTMRAWFSNLFENAFVRRVNHRDATSGLERSKRAAGLQITKSSAPSADRATFCNCRSSPSANANTTSAPSCADNAKASFTSRKWKFERSSMSWLPATSPKSRIRSEPPPGANTKTSSPLVPDRTSSPVPPASLLPAGSSAIALSAAPPGNAAPAFEGRVDAGEADFLCVDGGPGGSEEAEMGIGRATEKGSGEVDSGE